MGEGRDRALVDLVGGSLGSSSLGSQCREGLLALEDMQKNIFMLATEMQKLI